MARLAQAEAILEAAEQWKMECLLGGGSVFSDKRLWTPENFAQLERYYVENLDEGEGNFFSKLTKQLGPASAEAKQLAAEVFWVMYLVVSKRSVRAETKRFQIKKVWEWSGEPLPEGHPFLGELLAQGVSSPGTAYHTHRWRELVFFVTAMVDWMALSAVDKEDLLADPWLFAKWLEDQEQAKGRQLRHVLLYLLFPDTFDRILTTSHKTQIVRKYNALWGLEKDIDFSDRVAIDRATFEVRERLEREAEEGEVDFYSEAQEAIWKEPKKARPAEVEDASSETREEDAGWLQERFGDVQIWAFNPGEGARMWAECLEAGIICIGWDGLGDLAEYESKDAIYEALSEGDEDKRPINDALANWQFLTEMQQGDIVIAKEGRSKLRGWGRVTGDYSFEPERAEYQHTRQVEWEAQGAWPLPKSRWITNKTLTDFTGSDEWLRWAFTLMSDEEGAVDGSTQVQWPVFTVEDGLEDLFLPASDFSRILDTLTLQKNVILQGPPGVGKTFIAKRIAWALIGRKDPTAVQMIQFHQSYAYEDFIQGWRPTESGGFRLRDGVFLKFCEQAQKRPDQRFVFIIDEINRGNLSRIFGELLMLIERDKRGEDHAVPLTYGEDGDSFFVPENVHVLGMMNTADRSLAMVDYALRRRFGFVDLEPAFGGDEFLEYLFNTDMPDSVVKLIDRRMKALNEEISDDSKNLGPGFRIGHSYFVPTGQEVSLDEDWYRGVIRTQVKPLLKEYWFDRQQRVDRLLGMLLQ